MYIKGFYRTIISTCAVHVTDASYWDIIYAYYSGKVNFVMALKRQSHSQHKWSCSVTRSFFSFITIPSPRTACCEICPRASAAEPRTFSFSCSKNSSNILCPRMKKWAIQLSPRVRLGPCVTHGLQLPCWLTAQLVLRTYIKPSARVAPWPAALPSSVAAVHHANDSDITRAAAGGKLTSGSSRSSVFIYGTSCRRLQLTFSGEKSP